MASRLTEIIVDCADLDRMTEFWCAALGYERATAGVGWITLCDPGREVTDDALRAGPQPPAVSLVAVRDSKMAKNRVHIDITPIDRARDEEVARLESLGATRVDIGQGETAWTVMADPEGNEFCVMPEIDLSPG